MISWTGMDKNSISSSSKRSFSNCGPSLRNVLEESKEKCSWSHKQEIFLKCFHLLENHNEHLYILSEKSCQ